MLFLLNSTAPLFVKYRTKMFLLSLALIFFLRLANCFWEQAVSHEETRKGNISAALVQYSPPIDKEWVADRHNPIVEKHEELALKAAKGRPSVIVFPSYALHFNAYRNPVFFQEFVRQYKTYLLVTTYIPLVPGCPINEVGQHEAALLFSPSGKLEGRYIATQAPPLRKINQVTVREPDMLAAPFGKLGVLICYEDAISEVARKEAKKGTEILLAVSNPGHFTRTFLPQCHLIQDQYRAIETGRFVMRASANGYSAIIDPKGRILNCSTLGREEILFGKVACRGGLTPFVRWGDRVHLISVFVLVLLILISIKRKFSRSAVAMSTIAVLFLTSSVLLPVPAFAEAGERAPQPVAASETSADLAAEYLDEGKALVKEGRLWEAVKVFSDALELSPPKEIVAECYIERAKAFLETGAAGLAYRDLQRAKHIAPDLSAVPYLMGKLYRIFQYYMPALEEINKAIKRDPYNYDYLLERAEIYLRLKRFKDVVEEVEKLRVGRAVSEADCLCIASAYICLGNTSLGLGELNKALAINKDSLEAKRMRARILQSMGKHEEAASDILCAVNSNPLLEMLSDEKEHFKKGLPFNYKEEMEKTLDDLDLLLRLKPDAYDAYLMRVRVFLALHLPSDALNSLDEFLRLKPDSAEGYFLKGEVYKQMSQYEAALAALDEALKQDPGNVKYIIEKSTIFLSQVDVENAKVEIEKAKQIDPQNPFLLQAEGILCLVQGEEDEACIYFRQFAGEAPNPFYKTGFCSFQLARESYIQHHDLQRFLQEAADYPLRFRYKFKPDETLRKAVLDKTDFVKKFQEFSRISDFYKNEFRVKDLETFEQFDKSLVAPFFSDEKLKKSFEEAVKSGLAVHPDKSALKAEGLIDSFRNGKFQQLSAGEKEILLRAFIIDAPIWRYKKGPYTSLADLIGLRNFGGKLFGGVRRRQAVGLSVVSTKELYRKRKEDWVVGTRAYYSGGEETVYIKDEGLVTLKDGIFTVLHELIHCMTVKKGLLYNSEDVTMVVEGLANELTFSLLKEMNEMHTGCGYDYIAAEKWLQYYWYPAAFSYTMGQVFSEIVHEETISSWSVVLKEIIANPEVFYEKLGIEEDKIKGESKSWVPDL